MQMMYEAMLENENEKENALPKVREKVDNIMAKKERNKQLQF